MVNGKNRSIWKSAFFVVAQFACLGYLFLSGPFLADSSLLLGVEAAGILLGAWAVVTMRIGHFNIAPDPLAWSKLVNRGPYSFIRHPMYLALLLMTLPLVLAYFSIPRALVWVGLLLTLLIKLNYEEKLLASSLPAYAGYARRTARLIPGLY